MVDHSGEDFNKPVIMNVNNLVGLDSLNVSLVMLLDVIQMQCVSHCIHSSSDKSLKPPEEILGFSALFVIHEYLLLDHPV